MLEAHQQLKRKRKMGGGCKQQFLNRDTIQVRAFKMIILLLYSSENHNFKLWILAKIKPSTLMFKTLTILHRKIKKQVFIQWWRFISKTQLVLLKKKGLGLQWLLIGYFLLQIKLGIKKTKLCKTSGWKKAKGTNSLSMFLQCSLLMITINKEKLL